MKSVLILVLSPLFLIGVFGDEVSVMEGDSVTLHTGVTEIQKNDRIQWRLNGTRIAKLSSDSKGISVLIDPNGAFGDRLKLDDKTGELKITNIKTTDAGEYKLEITGTRGSSEKTFNVNVVASADGDAVMSVSVSVSVQVRDSVTLHTKIQRYDVIQWRFGPQHSLVAEINRKARIVSTHDGPDGRFRDRLKLDDWTGSLTIRNIGENHTGVYEVDISSSGYTIHKTFNVTVSDAVKSVSVTEGESVPLNTGLTEIQRDDKIEWMFRDTPIAEHPDRFRDRLKLDHQTGSLTIKNTRNTDSGLYEVTISGSRRTVHKRFTVTVSGVFGGDVVSVMEGESVTLHADAKIKINQIEWRFGLRLIASIDTETNEISVDPEGAFGGRLQLDNQTGDLKITNIRISDSGLYNLQINSEQPMTFSVSVVPANPVKTVSVMDGDSVTLNTELQRYDVIQWRFGPQHSLVAEISRAAGIVSTHDGPDGRFKDRLKLDYWTGSLTIKNIGTRQSGLYEVTIRGSKHTIHKTFSVTVSGEIKSVLSVKEGESVTLDTGLTEIQTNDSIHWMFGDTDIAEIYKAGDRFSLNDDERFRDRLKPDRQTGSLTITNTRFTNSGDYKLKIISSRRTVHRRFTVTVTGPDLSSGAVEGIVVVVILVAGAVAGAVAGVIYYRQWISKLKRQMPETVVVTEGKPVTLKPYGSEILKDDIQWKFEGTLIAERKGVNGEITVHDDVRDGIFKDRLELDKDGSLIITDTRFPMSGPYELRIIKRGRETFMKTFSVSVFAKITEMLKVSVKAGDNLTLSSGVTEIQRDDQIQWKFELEDSPIAQIKGGTPEISPSAADGRFRDRLELDQTGSLTIENIRPKDAGFYYLYITKSGKSIKLFMVDVRSPSDVEKNPEETSEACRNNPEEVPLTHVNVSDSRL